MDGDTNLPAVLEGQLLPAPLNERGSLWDTAAFEQTERVATIMADSGLLPQVLTHVAEGQGNNRQMVALPDKVIFARAVLIANQARHLDVDPVLFAQSCSIVHGRLMYEGKLVDAMIEKRLRWKLDYEFGLWNTDHFEPVDEERKLWGVAERLAVRVTAMDRDGKPVLGLDGKPRSIEGSVGIWKTTGTNSPWGSPANWRRQLRYRGAREWARAHSSGIMVGIVATDEADELEYQGEQRSVIDQGRATPALLHDGFKDEPAPADPPRKPRQARAKASDPPPASEAERSLEAKIEATEALDAALDGDKLPDSVTGDRPTETGPAQTAEPQPATSDAAPPASSDGAKATNGATIAAENSPSGEAPSNPEAKSNEAESETGHASPGEVYLLKGESPAADGRRLTYKDGNRFSTVGPDGAAKLAEYDMHAPVIEEATDDPLDGFIVAVEAATTWLDIKREMATFYNTDFFKALPVDQQNSIRANTWKEAQERKVEGLPDHAVDVSAFRLWLEWCADPDAIRGTLAVLEREPAFDSKEPTFKDAIRKAVASRVERLKR